MDKKVGLCLAFKGTNYGMHLQGYATQYVVDRLGYKTEIIDYYSGANKGIKLSGGALYVAVQKIAKQIIKQIKKDRAIDKIHQINIDERKAVSDEFRNTRLHDIIRIEGITQLKQKSKEYSAVLVGSDQIWLPDVAFSNFFTLRFAAPGVKRISYATSLGVSSYPRYAKKAAAEFWKKIDYLSVREEQGRAIIESIAGVSAQVVCDPTYLLTKEEWSDIIPQEKIVKDGYVLCYFLGDSDAVKQYAKQIAQKKNCDWLAY